MKKKIYITLITLGALLICGSLYLYLHGDKHLRSELSTRLSQLLARPVEVKGPIRFAYSNGLNLQIPKLVLAKQSELVREASIEGLQILVPSSISSIDELIVSASKIAIDISLINTPVNESEDSSTDIKIPCIPSLTLPQISIAKLELIVEAEDESKNISYKVKNMSLSQDKNGKLKILKHGTLNSVPLKSEIRTESHKEFIRSVTLQTSSPNSAIELAAKMDSHCNLSLDIKANGQSLEEINSFYPLELLHLGPYELSASISLDKKQILAKSISAKLGKSSITGSAIVSADSIEANLESELLRVVDFTEHSSSQHTNINNAEAGPADKTSAETNASDFLTARLPLDVLNQLNLQINLKADRLELAKDVIISNYIGSLSSTQGKSELVIEQLQTYNGKLNGNLSLDTSQEIPRVKLRLDGKEFSINTKNAQGQTDVSIPPTSLFAELETKGWTIQDFLSSTTGVAQSSTVAGMTSLDELSFVLRGFSDVLGPIFGKAKDDNIHCLVTKTVFTDGEGVIEPLLLHAAKVAFFGTGSVSLKNQAVDILVSMKSDEPTLASLLIPLRIGGPFSKLSVRPDATATAKELIQAPVSTVSLAARTAKNSAENLLGNTKKDTEYCDTALVKLSKIQVKRAEDGNSE